MRSFSFSGASVLVLIAGTTTLISSVVVAGELFVMPYTCAIVGGQPQLSLSRNQGHAVIGVRDKRDFVACSPTNPDMCRRWTVHKFDIDCGGVRVPWTAVAAAAEAQRSGRSWVENGRLQLEMPLQWGMRPDDPCAQAWTYRHRWRFDKLRRYCERRVGDARRPVVSMPPGFAPMLGIDGIFVPDDGHGSAAPPIARATPPAIEPPAPVPRTARVEPPAAKPSPEPAAKASRPAAEPPAPPPSSAKKPQSEAAITPPTPKESGAAMPAPVVPTIINRPPSAPSEPPLHNAASPQPPSHSAAPSHSEPAPPANPPHAVADTPASNPPVANETTTKPADQRVEVEDGQPATLNLMEIVASPTKVTMFSVGALALLGLITFAMMRRRGRDQPEVALARDIAAVSLDEKRGRQDVVAAHDTGLAAPAPMTGVVHRHSLSPAAHTSPSLDWGDSIPQTREEALRILGMGVAPTVNETAIKKIIDGLRLSWHPDHAESPEDREMRERRMKQINAAWEIIAGRRAAS